MGFRFGPVENYRRLIYGEQMKYGGQKSARRKWVSNWLFYDASTAKVISANARCSPDERTSERGESLMQWCSGSSTFSILRSLILGWVKLCEIVQSITRRSASVFLNALCRPIILTLFAYLQLFCWNFKLTGRVERIEGCLIGPESLPVFLLFPIMLPLTIE